MAYQLFMGYSMPIFDYTHNYIFNGKLYLLKIAFFYLSIIMFAQIYGF